ncbi:hypothetical protein HK101_010657 [Irineochytrium annulatum]|nr:hypothetical protein HK101_010657 [Irineochytrium annulatum]
MALKIALFALAGISSTAAWRFEIYLNVDNHFNLKIKGPDDDLVVHDFDGMTWQNTNIVSTEVSDDESYLLVAITASNDAGIAGFSAVALVDDKLYAATNPSDTEFKFSRTPVAGWDTQIVDWGSPNFASIAEGGGNSTGCRYAAQWGDVTTQLMQLAHQDTSLNVDMVWPGRCDDTEYTSIDGHHNHGHHDHHRNCYLNHNFYYRYNFDRCLDHQLRLFHHNYRFVD